jgi:hypothetical protein
MQIVFKTQMTSEEYVSERGWLSATLHSCPVHAEGGCGFRAHGSYGRKQPVGVRVARWYCAIGQVTFSLLPEFLAASFSGTLPELEEAVAAAEQSLSISEAARQLRPELADDRSAARWLRRRLSAVSRGLMSLVTTLPELMGTLPTLSALAAKVGAAPGAVLVTLRAKATSLLYALPTPLGFRHRKPDGRKSIEGMQHAMAPAPE